MKILYIERKFYGAVSIEKVFRQIVEKLEKNRFRFEFEAVPYLNSVFGTFKNLLYYRPKPADIYHITGDIHYIALILPKNRTILTVHDVGILHIRKGLRRFILKKILVDWPVRRLKYITAVSEKTKRDIIYFTNCSEGKIRVIENPLRETLAPGKIKEFNSDCPVILQIGTTYNKNLRNLIKALKEIKCLLKIVGEIPEDIKILLEENNIVFENRSNLSDEEMRTEYENADIMAFCSTFEGFGLPVIEAQKMMTPVLTSNISPLKEVAADGALLIDPENVSSIRDGIKNLIANKGLRDDLVRKGLENTKRFEAKKISEQYQNLYEEIYQAL